MRSGRATRGLLFVAVLGCLGVLLFGIGSAGGADRTAKHFGGIVPVFGKATRSGPAAAGCHGPNALAGCGLLAYHGGPVMHSTTVYTIFWLPTGYTSWDGGAPYSSNYQSLVNRYFQDLAADSGKYTNVNGAAIQYCNGPSLFATNCNGQPGANHITTDVTFGGTWTDTQAFPASGCTDALGNPAVCLTDGQLVDEINHAIGTNGLGWTKSATHMFFIYTPRGVTSCFDSGGPSGICAYNYYCAYHSNSGNGGSALIYADMAYPVQQGFDLCEDENNAQHPNGDAPADIVLSTTSHEHNEAITEPEVNPDFTGWYDDNDFFTGGENGDKCAYYYGKSTGTNGAKFNQTINGNPYYLQLEWSNSNHDCVAAYKNGPSVSKLTPNHGVVGQPIKITAKNLGTVSGVTFNSTPAGSFTQAGSKLSAVVAPGTTSGPIHVDSGSGPVTGPTFTVDASPTPTIKSFTPAGAHVGSTVKVSGTGFWGASVTINGLAQVVTVKSATQLSFVVAGGTTTGPIRITTLGGFVDTAPLTIS